MVSDIRAVVFDLGGVLIDWNPRYVYRRMFASEADIDAFMAETGIMEMNASLDAGRPFAEGVAELAARFPHHAAPIRAWREQWPAMLGGAIDETVALLDRLRQGGIPLYALTNWSAETFPVAQARFDFLGWFRHIVVSGEVGLAKPDPRIFDIVLRWTDSAPHQTLFIDDSPKNVEAAKRLGFRTLHFTGAAPLAADLTSLGVIKN